MESSGGGKREEEDVGSYNSNNVKKARLHSTLTALLDDPILADVPKEPTLSDVDTLINLELGSAMRISVIKLDSTSFGTNAFSSTYHFPFRSQNFKKRNPSNSGQLCLERKISEFFVFCFFF